MIREPVVHFPFILLLLTTPVAEALNLTGQVTGGAERHGVFVAALSSRNLRDPSSVIAVAPVASDGRFSVPLPAGAQSAWLVVTERCDPRRLDCRRYLPTVDRAVAGVPARLEVPDPELAAAVWSGGAVPTRSFAWFGWGAIAALLGLAWVLREPDRHPQPDRQLTPWVPVLVALPLVLGLSLVGLGAEPLDLLEYTYFHEALRPPSVASLLADSLSTELAHGPVYPLLLRALGTTEPFWLRLPSVVLGAGFVVLVGIIAGRAAGRHAALGALCLAAVSPVAAYYARDATPYALVGFLAAAAVLLADLRATGTTTALRWTAFAAIHTLGFFAHYGFAFFSLAQGLGLVVGGLAQGQRRTLAHAALAFAASAVLPVLAAPQLERMLTASGLRFGLMSAVYPETPGLDAFTTTMLSVLAGGPADQPILLLGATLVTGLGLAVLWRAHRVLAAQAAACLVLVVVWLVFSHTMSVSYGGGRIYWAFRWARPMLVGVVIAAGTAAALPLGRWLVAGQVAVGAWMLSTTVAPPVRPAQTEVAAWVRERAQPGDAFAVLPASFYGDQALYYLSNGSPPSLVSAMRTAEIPTPAGTLRGPYVELEVPLETAVDRRQHRRVFVLAFDEHLFGVPKFSPVARDQLLQAMGHWRLRDQLHAAHLDAWLFECDERCAWGEARSLEVALDQTLAADRYVLRAPGDGPLPYRFPVTLALPPGTHELRFSGCREPTCTDLELTAVHTGDGPQGTPRPSPRPAGPGSWRVDGVQAVRITPVAARSVAATEPRLTVQLLRGP